MAKPNRIDTVRGIHRWNAIVLAAFIVTHLTAHLFAIFGAEAHNDALASIQWAYRPFIVETGLLVLLATQIALGVRLAFFRWPERQKSVWARLQLWSGLYLLLFILNHASSAIIARYGLGLDTDFTWVSTPLTTPLIQWFFYPYYALAVGAIAVHVAAAFHFSGRSRSAIIIAVAALPVATLYLMSFGGWIFPVEPDPTYQKIYGL